MDTAIKIVTKSAELYGVAPSFFNWAVPIIISLVPLLIFASWWFRGYFVEGNEALLRGQLALQVEQLKLASAQNEDMKRQITDLREQVAKLSEQEKLEVRSPELAAATSILASSVDRLLSANTAQSGTLSYIGGKYQPSVPERITSRSD